MFTNGLSTLWFIVYQEWRMLTALTDRPGTSAIPLPTPLRTSLCTERTTTTESRHARNPLPELRNWNKFPSDPVSQSSPHQRRQARRTAPASVTSLSYSFATGHLLDLFAGDDAPANGEGGRAGLPVWLVVEILVLRP